MSAIQPTLEQEDQRYIDDVNAVKKWWSDSRWRHTKRPFTAEEIVAKRGNLKIDYPSNAMSKKAWALLEQRWKVRGSAAGGPKDRTDNCSEQDCQFHIRLPRAHHDHSDGQVPRHYLRLRLAIIVDGLLDRRAVPRSC